MNSNAHHPADTPALRPHVQVRAAARLHLGFLDPAAHLGRRFGSLGLVIDGFETHVELSRAAADGVDAGAELLAADRPVQQALARVSAHLAALRQHTGLLSPVHLRLHSLPPAHAGFGSGTQLALAVGRAFALHHGVQVATATLATWLGRGLRSGVGIAGFDQGGLLLDGGPLAASSDLQPTLQHPQPPAPLLARVVLPSAWRVLLVLDPRLQGLSGAGEKRALATLAPLPQAASADLCHQVLMRVLPGAADAQFEPFASGISHMQQVLGLHFAPAQQGRAYTSAAVQRVLQWVAAATGPGGAAVGQSSWGPTGFAIVPTQARAEELLLAARAAGVLDPALHVHTVSARNQGAQQWVDDAPLPSAARPLSAAESCTEQSTKLCTELNR